MTDDQRIFLQRRLHDFASRDTRILELRKRLLEHGGDEIVVPASEPDLADLLQRGRLQIEPSVLQVYEESNCHENSAALWLQKQADAIGTGYALSEDSLWRQHSWAVQNGLIIETTEARTHYFGLLLQGEAAREFASRYFVS